MSVPEPTPVQLPKDDRLWLACVAATAFAVDVSVNKWSSSLSDLEVCLLWAIPVILFIAWIWRVEKTQGWLKRRLEAHPYSYAIMLIAFVVLVIYANHRPSTLQIQAKVAPLPPTAAAAEPETSSTAPSSALSTATPSNPVPNPQPRHQTKPKVAKRFVTPQDPPISSDDFLRRARLARSLLLDFSEAHVPSTIYDPGVIPYVNERLRDQGESWQITHENAQGLLYGVLLENISGTGVTTGVDIHGSGGAVVNGVEVHGAQGAKGVVTHDSPNSHISDVKVYENNSTPTQAVTPASSEPPSSQTGKWTCPALVDG
jgi:hypothetical protein